MFSKGFKLFSQGAKLATSFPPKVWFEKQLVNTGLAEIYKDLDLATTQSSAKVFFNKKYLLSDKEIQDSLKKIPAVNVMGDRSGYLQDGTPFPNIPNYFENIKDDDPNFLSPIKRILAAKKIVASESYVHASGGYPKQNPVRLEKKPFKAHIFSLAGASFENAYLHYKLFVLDKNNANVNTDFRFHHLFKDTPFDFEEAKKVIGPYDGNRSMSRIRVGFPFLGRTQSGVYYPTFSKNSAVIFLTEPYYRHQLEDLSMLLKAVDNTAEKSGKQALLKATAVGMGFFAKVNCSYDIQHLIYPYYLRAFKKLLTELSYPHIDTIEFPIFDEKQDELFDSIFSDYHGPIKVIRSTRDVLDFSEKEKMIFTPCLINPSDAFSYTGNEWGPGSVEAMIGLDTSLRFDRVHHANPLILEPPNFVGVDIKPDWSADLIYRTLQEDEFKSFKV